jgi:hypothetical protein
MRRLMIDVWSRRAAGVALILLTCGSPAAGQANADAVPKNYRQLIVRKLAQTMDLRTVREASITAPGKRWMGVIRGGMLPIVCVTLAREGIAPYDALGFTFRNGQISEMFTPDKLVCVGPDWHPFREAMSGRASRQK